ncbi:MAG: hypothetical protein Q8K98_02155 [Bacteroidota bacterium]|nr:hypothetical protein [Bacteroidota bacterium]
MKNLKFTAAIVALFALFMFVASSDAYSQTKGKGNGVKGFVDLNGDGINDHALDADGDGIPNGKDPDFVKPQDGTGRKMMNGKTAKSGKGGFGPGDGTGNKGVGPRDGSGNGPGTGTGDCDGTGAKGNLGRRGK